MSNLRAYSVIGQGIAPVMRAIAKGTVSPTAAMERNWTEKVLKCDEPRVAPPGGDLIGGFLWSSRIHVTHDVPLDPFRKTYHCSDAGLQQASKGVGLWKGRGPSRLPIMMRPARTTVQVAVETAS
jgi:hypothetical protein